MSARVVGLLAVVAAAVAITGESGLIAPAPLPLSASAGQPLPLTRSAPTLVCPGPETLQAPAGAEAVPPGGAVLLRALLAPPDPPVPGPAPAGASGDPQTATLAQMQAAGTTPVALPLAPAGADGQSAGLVQGMLDRSGPWRLDAGVDPSGRPPRSAVLQSTLAPAGDLRGLVTTSCGSAVADVWLVGGGTDPGRRGRLLLANPTSSPATADVLVLGPTGPVASPAGTAVLIPPGGQTALLLDALAPGLSRTAVHVSTRSGRVVATLHDSVLRGLVPGGADDVTPTAPPATGQLVPGVMVTGVPEKAGGQPQLPSDPLAAGATAVRVAVPGTDEAIVRVRLIGRTGAVDLGAGGVVTVAGGSVVDIPITGVDPGLYGAQVESDVPVVAGAIVGQADPGSMLAGTDRDPLGAAPPAEFGWAAATAPLTGTRLVALPVPDTTPTVGPLAGVAMTGARPTGPPPTGAPSTGPATGSGLGLVATLGVTTTSGPAVLVVTELDGKGRPGAVHRLSLGPATTSTLSIPATDTGLLVDPGSADGVHLALVLTRPTDQRPMVSVVPIGPEGAGPGVTPVAVDDPTLGLH